MKTINVPGFTAEVSLYRTIGRYHLTAGFDSNGGVIQPQKLLVPPLPGPGDEFCICPCCLCKPNPSGGYPDWICNCC